MDSAPPPCSLPEVLDALAGRAPAADLRYVVAPPGVGDRAPAPPPAGKGVYGTSYAHHLETENFTINWADGDASDAVASQVAEGMELGWSYFVEDAAWDAPVSSDRYYVWVILDPSLSGTGYTTEYTTEEYPDGYPVIYINPEYSGYVDFFRLLAVHEFHHAVAFGYRDYWNGGADEAWYWEASAQWAAYLAEPGSTAFDYSAEWYADHTEYDFDSTEDYHHYGIFVLNAFLHEAIGEHAMRGAWEESRDRTGDPWDGILESSTGTAAPDLWAGFAWAFGNELLAGAAGWARPQWGGTVSEGLGGTAAELGTVYYRVLSQVGIDVEATEGEVVWLARPGAGGSYYLDPGDVFAVTAVGNRGAEWVLRVGEALLDEPGDTGGGDTGMGDTGAGDTSVGDTASLDTGDDPPGDEVDPVERGEPVACGCGVTTLPGAAAVVGAGLLVLSTRRKVVPGELR